MLFEYEDAQCEYPERLVAEWLMEAAAAGAVPLNYCEVLGVPVTNGRARGVIVRDHISGRKNSSKDAYLQLHRSMGRPDMPSLGIGHRRAHGRLRGTHLVLPRFAGAPYSAIYTQADGGRKIFVIPWDRQILLGTTEVRPGR